MDEDFRRLNEALYRMAEMYFRQQEAPRVYGGSPAEQSVTGIKHVVERTGWEQTREVSLYYDKLWLGELGIKG